MRVTCCHVLSDLFLDLPSKLGPACPLYAINSRGVGTASKLAFMAFDVLAALRSARLERKRVSCSWRLQSPFWHPTAHDAKRHFFASADAAKVGTTTMPHHRHIHSATPHTHNPWPDLAETHTHTQRRPTHHRTLRPPPRAPLSRRPTTTPHHLQSRSQHNEDTRRRGPTTQPPRPRTPSQRHDNRHHTEPIQTTTATTTETITNNLKTRTPTHTTSTSTTTTKPRNLTEPLGTWRSPASPTPSTPSAASKSSPSRRPQSTWPLCGPPTRSTRAHICYVRNDSRAAEVAARR